MHVFSTAVRSTRKRAQVRWVSPDRVLLDKHDISVAAFKAHIIYRLECLETFFKDNLLFGHTLNSLGIVVDFVALEDTGDEKTLWYSPLLGSVDGNTDSTKVLGILLADESCGMVQRQGGEIVWDQDLAESWIFDIHKATGEVHAVTHISQGSAGRITEEAKMQLSNTPVGRRHVFITPGINTLCLWSDYWKGASKSGQFKEALRVIPFRVSRLLFILNRIIRSLALRYLAKYRISADETS